MNRCEIERSGGSTAGFPAEIMAAENNQIQIQTGIPFHRDPDYLIRDSDIPEPRGDEPESEQVLQWIWARQNLHRHRLQSICGKAVEVLHPGFWNRGSGPDFSRALLRIGGVTGTHDVEVELAVENWHSHGHHRDFHFAHVGLLVVWEEPSCDAAAAMGIPILAIRRYLNAPLAEMHILFHKTPVGEPTCFESGRCRPVLGKLDEETHRHLLESAALSRLRVRARAVHAWESEYDPPTALLLSLMTALGMPGNSWPMRFIAEKLADSGFLQQRRSWLESQALLLGLSNLLPADSSSKTGMALDFINQLWEIWWRHQDECFTLILPRSIWNMRKIRPMNHPERRLALGAYWVGLQDLPGQIIDWTKSAAAGTCRSSAMGKLEALLRPPHSDFWHHHFSLSCPEPMPRPTGLLGREQLVDLAMNSIIPWILARAEIGRDGELRSAAHSVMQLMPPAAENHRTRHLRTRLFGDRNAGPRGKAVYQQGLLQVEIEFCQKSDSLCSRCPLPSRLQGLKNNAPAAGD